MKKQNEDFNNDVLPKMKWLSLCFLLILIAMLVFGCSVEKRTMRAYKRVAADKEKPINTSKKSLIVAKCLENFPIKSKSDTVIEVEYNTDTAAYNSLVKVIDDLLLLLEKDKKCPQINKDSLVTAIKQSVKPDTVKIRTKIKDIQVDSALVFFWMDSSYNANQRAILYQTNYEAAAKEVEQFKKDKRNIGTLFIWFGEALIRKWWFWLLITLLTAYFFFKTGLLSKIKSFTKLLGK